MRLTCPNCSAQYEIDPAMIPVTGRDVQCSACSHTWFFDRKKAVQEDKAVDDGGYGDGMSRQTTSRELDDETRRILREEAERDAARRSDPPPKEPEAAGDAAADTAKPATYAAAQEPTPHPEPDDTPSAMATEPSAAPGKPAQAGPEDGRQGGDAEPSGAREEDLPDVERITSTLAPAASGAAPTARASGPVERPNHRDDPPRRRGGVGLGFWLVVLLAACLAALYFAAPRLIESVPALEPVLVEYLDYANTFRAWAGEMAERFGLTMESRGEASG